MRLILAALAAAVMLIAAKPAVDWSKRVTQTAEGAFVLGNPAAKNRLVEYVSYTCDHCAHFTGEASAALRTRYAGNGGTAIEIRHAVRDPIDLAATLLARCTGPSRFFTAHERLFATQPEWLQRGGNYLQANQSALQAAAPAERLKLLAESAGLGAVVGLNEGQVRACLSNPAQQRPVLAMANEAWQTRSIPGTPYFLLNGVGLENTSTWALLEPRLNANK